MGGYTIDDCLEEQRRLNAQHWEHKRQLDEDEQETPQAKAARVNTDQEGGAAEEIDTEPDEADDSNETDNAIFERWYGMHGKK